MGAVRGQLVDHWNRESIDNRIENLRVVTRTQNNCNRGPERGGTSPYKGVCWNTQMGKWQAKIALNRRVQHLGFHTHPQEAALAYDFAARQLHGSFAFTNCPDEL